MELKVRIVGIVCAGCVSGIDSKLRQLNIEHFDYDFSSHIATMEYNESTTTIENITSAIKELGYQAYPKVF